jgi:pimeloyl-ACP methyl ester carboxylesterase
MREPADAAELTALGEQFPARSVATPDGVITYRSTQGSRPLVLLHGIGSASGSWLRQLQALGGSHRVLAWDAPGYGGSDPLPAPEPTAEDYGRRVWQWLDALELGEPVTLVGHSLGSLMAAAAASQQPSRVQRLVLLAPARGYGRAEAAERDQKRRDRLKNLETLGPAGMADKRSAAMLSPQAPPELVAFVRSIMAQVRPDGYAQATHMLANGDLAGLLARVTCPTLVASGTADTITPAQGCRSLAEQAGLEYVSLGNVGHACPLEAASAVCELITRETHP